jgi:hypothetical protein
MRAETTKPKASEATKSEEVADVEVEEETVEDASVPADNTKPNQKIKKGTGKKTKVFATQVRTDDD